MPNVKKATTVLQEVLASGITPAHVKRRVHDWKSRIEYLYAQIASWMPPGWTVHRKRRYMRELMMKAHNVPAAYLPCLELRSKKRQRMLIVPDCLWVIGFNGRLYLIGKEANYFIADTAGIFEKPNWRLIPVYTRKWNKALNGKMFKSILRNEGTCPHSRRLSGNKRRARTPKSARQPKKRRAAR